MPSVLRVPAWWRRLFSTPPIPAAEDRAPPSELPISSPPSAMNAMDGNDHIDNVRALLREHSITLKETIGKGSYSNVRLGYSIKMDQTIAVKVIDTSSNSEYVRRFLPRELNVVQQLNHANIVRVFQVLRVDGMVLLVEEYGKNGDLLKKIKQKSRIPEIEAAHYFRQMIEALEYLKVASIVHRDIKCENVFLDACDNVKLGDFGFARFLRGSESSSTFCGSKAYVAPEILSGTAYTGFTVDAWSAGIVLYIMVTGVMPYDDRHPKKMLERMSTHRIRYPRSIETSPDVQTLIYEILHPTPASRLTYPQMKNSRWLAYTDYTTRTEPFAPPSTQMAIDGEGNKERGKGVVAPINKSSVSARRH